MTGSFTFTVGKLCILIALVAFVLAFFGVEPFGGHSLVDAGLAFLAAGFIV